MDAWSVSREDGMGPAVTRPASAKPSSAPPLKNGRDLRASGYLIAVGSRTARFRRRYHLRKSVLVIALLLLLLILAITMTVLYIEQKLIKPPRLCETKECLRSATNLLLSMDDTADPCEDFHQYSCGNWADEHPRPDKYHSYDWFREKQIKVYSAVRDYLDKNITGLPKPVQQAQDMYAACMDLNAIESVGLKPIFSTLEAVGLPTHPKLLNIPESEAKDYAYDWLEIVINIKITLGMDIFIGFDIFPDPKNSSTYRMVLGSPETVNPFPSVFDIRRRKHKYPFKKTKKKDTRDLKFKFNFESETREYQIHETYYSSLMKILYKSVAENNTVLTDQEITDRCNNAAGFYYNQTKKMYELESLNATDDEVEYREIPDYTVDELQAYTDAFLLNFNSTPTPIWKRYLEGIFRTSNVTLDFVKDRILISDPDMIYLAMMARMVADTPDYELELFTWIKVVEVLATHATTELRGLFYRAYYELHPWDSNIPPRSLHCSNAVNDMMGMAVAYGIIEPHFFTVTKPKIETMLYELKNALAHLIGQVNWMDDNTKLATYQKIIQMKSLIGFPEWLLDDKNLEEYYKGIEVDRKTHLNNMLNIIQTKVRNALNTLRETNQYGWATDPTEVNAYHTFQENSITIPVVMLQYPFFDLGLDSLNYGSLGAVLGHEITHGFDDFGRKFDKNGNMVPWWSNSTIASYDAKTSCFVRQYSEYYIPEIDEHVDGSKTLGENIADNGGLREAFAALKHHLRKYGPEQKLPGFEHLTSEQLFFLSYGNLWCGEILKDLMKAELEDEHSPLHLRARGALQNSEEFAKAWHCPPGSPMNPTDRCIIF